MQTKKIFALIIAVAFLACSINLVSAGTAQSGHAWGSTDNKGTQVDEVALHTTVNIYWVCAVGKTVDIKVTYLDPTSNVEVPIAGAEWTNQGAAENGTLAFQTSNGGYYYIYCCGNKSTLLSEVSVFALPESVLGSMMVVGAGLAAFGTIGLVKHKRAENKKP